MLKLPSTWVSGITNDARITREINCRIVMTKATFNEKDLFTSKMDLKEETSTVLHLEYSFDFSKSSSQICEKF
jgi:hypothetical protein